MENEKRYQAIFRRKSVRRYDMTPLKEDLLDEVSKLIPTLKPLYDIKTHISLVPGDAARGLRPIKAPHYLMFSSEKKEGHLVNTGFVLQQMDLALSFMGLGACWVGLAKPSKDVLFQPGMEFTMAMAFGKPMDSLYRESLSEFKRKPLNQIANTDEDPVLEAARLAPSSTNSQPWYFLRKKDLIHAYCVKNNAIKAMFYEKFNKMDMGIAGCHIWLAGLHAGKCPVFISDQVAKTNPPPDYEYILSIRL